VKKFLIFNSPKCILLNTYLNKIFLRSTFPEECQEDYFKELEDELNKQLQIESEVGQRKYQVTPPEPVFNE